MAYNSTSWSADSLTKAVETTSTGTSDLNMEGRLVVNYSGQSASFGKDEGSSHYIQVFNNDTKNLYAGIAFSMASNSAQGSARDFAIVRGKQTSETGSGAADGQLELLYNAEGGSLTVGCTLSEDGDFGIGQGTPVSRLHVYTNDDGYAVLVENDGDNDNRGGIKLCIGTDDSSGTNYQISFHDGDCGPIGHITTSSSTVSYGAFTANHDGTIPDADNDSGYAYGTLMETKNIFYTQYNGSNTERGIMYNMQKSSSAYSRKILGAYSNKYTIDDNNHQVYVLGDGHILCNNEKGNIVVGDGITASSTAGIGMKADKTCMIVGIAQEDVTFSGSETKLVAVQYGVRQFTPWTD